MKKNMRDQALALAGVLHAARQVRRLAREGRVDEDQFFCAIRPVFALEAESVAQVYGSTECRRSLLSVLRAQLGGGTERDLEATRYSATLMHLERKLRARDDLMQALREGIEAARRQAEHFSITHENVIARLAALYSSTISTLEPRILVEGDPRYLQDTHTANRVRALLLAGMRSTVLWRQCGGSRLKLIFGRNRLMRAASEADAETEGTAKEHE